MAKRIPHTQVGYLNPRHVESLFPISRGNRLIGLTPVWIIGMASGEKFEVDRSHHDTDEAVRILRSRMREVGNG